MKKVGVKKRSETEPGRKAPAHWRPMKSRSSKNPTRPRLRDREDNCRIRVGDAVQNFAILRRIALNLLKNEKTTKLAVAGKRLKAGWNSD